MNIKEGYKNKKITNFYLFDPDLLNFLYCRRIVTVSDNQEYVNNAVNS